MRTKQKNVLFDLFYTKFKMLDKMLYIERVLDSCKSEEQLDITFRWGTRLLWKYYDCIDKELDKYNSWIAFPTANAIIGRTKLLIDHIQDHYNVCLSKLS